MVKRGHHNSVRVKHRTDTGTRHTGPTVIQLANTSWLTPPMTTPKTTKPKVTALPQAS